MGKISAIINTYNEENNIKRCLESIKWADEIVVVDMHSTDKTMDIAKNYTKKIFLHKNTGFVEPARNFAISKTTGEWILIVDADEEITPALSKKLQEISQNDSADFVKIPRKNIIFGKWIKYSGWWPDNQVRFFKKGKVSWKKEIHSVPNVRGREITLESEEYAIVHYNYQSISQFLQRNFEVYAREEAKQKLKNGYVFSYFDAIRFPLNEFLSRFFARKGYKDGFHGLILSILMAFYHFLIFAYLWEKKGFVEYDKDDFLKDTETEFRKAGSELAFWISKEKLNSIKNPVKRNLRKVIDKVQNL